jgi:hypothetical protein
LRLTSIYRLAFPLRLTVWDLRSVWQWIWRCYEGYDSMYFLFIYGLCNSAVSSSGWWIRCGRKQVWPISRCYTSIVLERLRKTTKILSHDSQCLSWDSNQAPPKCKSEHCCLGQLVVW